MKYYMLENSAEKREVGYFYQTTGLVKGYDEYAANSMTKLDWEAFPDFTPDLRFDLEKKALVTDVVSVGNISARGLFINEKTRGLFENYRLGPHRYYEGILNVKNKVLGYYWLHFIHNKFEWVDLSRSVFYETTLFGDKLHPMEIKDFDDYMAKAMLLENSNRILASELVFTETFKQHPYDLFFLPYLYSDLLASENLIEGILKNEITGLNWEQASFI